MLNLFIKNRSFFYGAIFYFLLCSVVLFAQKRQITGVVLNSETNQTIPNVYIKIVELSKNLTCNNEGSFKLKEIEYGNYTFILSHLAYQENISKVEIDKNTNKIIAFYLIPKNIELSPVIVSDYKSYSKFDDLQELSNVLKGKQLEKQMGLTLASTLKNEAGLAMRSMGPAPSRPVIRGLSSDRVLISEDGTKTIDLSATSPDHAVTIDPFTISRIEVLRGPKILTQTSTTIGGIVNVVNEAIPNVVHEDLSGQAGLFGESVNSGYMGFLRLLVPVNNFVVKGEISKRKTKDLNTPKSKLKNSNSQNLNFSIASSYIFDKGFFGASFRRFDLDYGVPGGFVGAHPSGVDISMFKNQLNFKSEYNFSDSFFDKTEIDFNRVYYRHKEFEKSGSIGSEFEVIDYLFNGKLKHTKYGIVKNGIFGLSSEYRDFNIGGFVFTSPTKSLNISSFIFENLSYKKFNFELSARYNFDIITPQKEKPNAPIGSIIERIFNTYSLSFSTLYQQSEHVYFGFNVSKSSRVPTIEELFSEGPHLAAYSYEVGNPNLKAESGFGSEVFIYHNFKNIFFNFTFFGNFLDNYIIPRNSGETNYATFLPIYKTVGVKAILYGFESSIDWKFLNNLKLSNTLSYTNGKFKSGGYLPQIPPLKGLTEISYQNNLLNLGISGEWAFAQKNVDEFEKATAGYFVVNLFAQYSFIFEKNTSNISINIDNVLDQEYRNHLSRVKSILPEAGRNFRLSYKLFFHL